MAQALVLHAVPRTILAEVLVISVVQDVLKVLMEAPAIYVLVLTMLVEITV